MFNWLRKRKIAEHKIEFQTKQQLESAYAKAKLSWLFKKLQPKLRHAIKITLQPADDSTIPVGSSKVGGSPDLPESISWPLSQLGKPLFFTAQINLNQANKFDKANELPETGVLYFFHDLDDGGYGFEINNRDFHKVIFHDGTSELKRTKMPPRECDQDLSMDNRSCITTSKQLWRPRGYSVITLTKLKNQKK